MLQKMLDIIRQDPRIFTTGSRYWNLTDPYIIPITPDTDYDFVAEYSDEIAEELLALGFTFKDGVLNRTITSVDSKYEDGSTVLVMYFGAIQIILKRNVGVYLAVQHNLSPSFYKKYLWKKYSTIPHIQLLLNTLFIIEGSRHDNLHMQQRNG